MLIVDCHYVGYASITSDPASPSDPSLDRALDLIENGTRALEEGDLEAARVNYKHSLGIKETSGGWFNLGVWSTLPLFRLCGLRDNVTYESGV